MFGFLLAFAFMLFVAALLSGLARRTPLSTTALFLVVGFLLGNGALGVIRLPFDNPLVEQFATLALISVLFVDGMHLDVHKLAANRRLPARALLLGLPLTLLIAALLAHALAGLTWPESLLLGAVLSPTDPVFAAALIGRNSVSARLRHLLNIESGLNDGLALPIVLAMIAISVGIKPSIAGYVADILLGVAIGIGIAWSGLKLRQVLKLKVTAGFQPLMVLALGLMVFATAELVHANAFLGMFAAAVTVATTDPEASQAFQPLGERVAELMKLAAVLFFGALLSFDFLRETHLYEYLFALLVLLLARPIGLGLALLGSRLTWPERLVAVWFGPRGFASVVYGMFILGSGIARATDLFRLSAVVIVGSMILHSSTDLIAARWLQEAQSLPPQDKDSGPPVRAAPGGNEGEA